MAEGRGPCLCYNSWVKTSATLIRSGCTVSFSLRSAMSGLFAAMRRNCPELRQRTAELDVMRFVFDGWRRVAVEDKVWICQICQICEKEVLTKRKTPWWQCEQRDPHIKAMEEALGVHEPSELLFICDACLAECREIERGFPGATLNDAVEFRLDLKTLRAKHQTGVSDLNIELAIIRMTEDFERAMRDQAADHAAWQR